MRPLPALLAGLALGATASLAVRLALSTPPASIPASDPLTAHHSLPATSLISPRLPSAQAEAALDAWLALADTTPPADFAAQSAALRTLLTILPDELLPRLLGPLIARKDDAALRLRQTAFSVWVERDPAAAVRWALDAPTRKRFDDEARYRFCQQAIIAWGRRDFPASYAWATAIDDPLFHNAMTAQLLAHLAATDPARARALAQAQGPDFFAGAEPQLFAALAEIDPAAAVQSIDPDFLENGTRTQPLQQALAIWLNRDLPAATRWLFTPGRLAADPQGFFMRDLLQASISKLPDPGLFADALLARPDIPSQFDHLRFLLHVWSRRDAPATLAWLDALPDVAQRTELLEKLIPDRTFSLQDPERFLPLALHLPPGEIRDQKTAGLLALWADRDPDAALAWLHEHADPSLAPAAARVETTLITTLAATDPEAALARWQALPDGENKSLAAPSLAAAWARTDPAAAARWLADSLPPIPAVRLPDLLRLDRLRLLYSGTIIIGDIPLDLQNFHRAISTTVSLWAQKDALATLRWAETLDDPVVRQTALSALGAGAGAYGTDLPDRAQRAELLTRIADPALRTSTLAAHLQTWMRSDLPTARAWLQSHDALPPAQAAALLAAAR